MSNLSRKFSGKLWIAPVALAAFFFVAPHQTKADECQERVAKADHRLHEAIEHRGYDSREADGARHELREERERCWKSDRRWWDEDNRSWHKDRDWDDDDHSHYRDQDRH